MDDKWDDDDFDDEEQIRRTDEDDALVHEIKNVDFTDLLRYKSVKEVTNLLDPSRLTRVLQRLEEYNNMEAKNSIPQDDSEYTFVCDCSKLIHEIEAEKTKVFKFLRVHYAIRFPELATVVQDGIIYGKLTALIGNDVHSLESMIDEMDKWIPSQLIVVVVAAASTTSGRVLDDAELTTVKEAAQEMEDLEYLKQMFLEYVQKRVPLICPNLSAFLGNGITSQIFVMATSIANIIKMGPKELAELGSKRGNHSVLIKTVGFMSNSDLIAKLPPQLRPKGLRLVSNTALNCVRLDGSRRASDYSFGRSSREQVIQKMIQWTDPTGQRGAANNTYERNVRKRPRQEQSGGRRSFR